MLERLVAALLVIGVLLWGASILATPDEPLVDAPEVEPAAPEPAPSADPGVPRTAAEPVAQAERDDDEDDDEEREEREGRGKGKKEKGRGG